MDKKMDKKRDDLARKYMNKEVLLGILKTGILFGVAITAPGVLKIFKNFEEKDPWYEYYPSSVERTLNRLYRQGIVEVREKDGQKIVRITKKGKIEVLKYDFDKLSIQKQTKWDGKWRLVVFDIAEKHKVVREMIRSKLKEMGFYKFQESVFICPYPCENQIQYMREVLNIPHSIKLIRADRIENDRELRLIFKLH